MNSLIIEIPAKKNWGTIIFSTFWMGGWLIGFSFAIVKVISEIGNGNFDLFLTFWLAAWTFGGFMVIRTILWQLMGKELIILERNRLTIDRRLMGIGSFKNFEIASIKNLKVAPGDSNLKNILASGFDRGGEGGKLKFNYGYKTIKFARDIDEAEAEVIWKELMSMERFKRNVDRLEEDRFKRL